MKRTTILLAVATLLVATPGPRHADAQAISQYKRTSYRDGGVVLRMNAEKGSILNPGEDVSFTYQTSDDAYVILFNIDTEGYVNLIAPADGRLSLAEARETYRVPDGNERLVVSGETGMEFVFALSVADPSSIDLDELAYLRDLDGKPRADAYRIDGDPFLAANIIAGELVRGISHREGVYLDYVYFYVNDRVDHPCYLCGECDGSAATSDCTNYDVVANFDRAAPLTYPLRRAFDMVERGAPARDAGDMQAVYDDGSGDDRVYVTFYPYSVEARYITRPWAYSYDPWYWDDPFWYDPGACGWVYYPTWSYPYYRNYWGWSFWWGSWGGYYCSGWYYPRYHHWHDYYHDNYYGYRHVAYKKAYKERSQTLYKGSSSALVAARTEAVKRNDRLRIASTDLRRTTTKTRSLTRTDRTRTSIAARGDVWRDGKPTRVYTPRTGREITHGATERSSKGYYPGSKTGSHTSSGWNRSGTTVRPPTRSKPGSSGTIDRSRSTTRSRSSGSYHSTHRSTKPSTPSRSSGQSVKRSSGSSKSSAGSSSRSSTSRGSKGSSRSSSKAKKK